MLVLRRMFDIKIIDVLSWKRSIDAIAVIIDEAVLNISEKGLKLRAMDPSQIAMVDFSMPAESFDEYSVDRETSIGINFTELNRITRRAKNEDKIELSMEEKENTLGIVFRGKTTRKFRISLIDIDIKPPREPDISFTANVKIGSLILQDALRDAELIGNNITLEIDNDFKVFARGDTGKINIKFPEETILSITSDEKAKATYALEYFMNLIKAADPTTVVSIDMLTDAPVRIKYSIGDGNVKYYLAPRIESM